MRTAIVITAGILLAGMAGAQTQQQQPTLPEDPLLRCATKALAGNFGKLAAWQTQGYTLALSGKPVAKTAWLTQYFPQESRAFRRRADGGNVCRWWEAGCSERVLAANLLPAYTFVWIPRPASLRQVLDTGAKSNDRVARRNGADLWADEWVPYPGWKGTDTRVTKIYVIGRQP